jgi:hypothetical protein
LYIKDGAFMMGIQYIEIRELDRVEVVKFMWALLEGAVRTARRALP